LNVIGDDLAKIFFQFEIFSMKNCSKIYFRTDFAKKLGFKNTCNFLKDSEALNFNGF
jgi:hypothetical protein